MVSTRMEARGEALEQRIETMGTTLLEEMRALLAQRQNHDETDPGSHREQRERDRANERIFPHKRPHGINYTNFVMEFVMEYLIGE